MVTSKKENGMHGVTKSIENNIIRALLAEKVRVLESICSGFNFKQYCRCSDGLCRQGSVAGNELCCRRQADSCQWLLGQQFPEVSGVRALVLQPRRGHSAEAPLVRQYMSYEIPCVEELLLFAVEVARSAHEAFTQAFEAVLRGTLVRH